MNIDQFRSDFYAEKTRVHDLRNMAPSEANVSGRVMINAAGEARALITFPVKFTTVPLFTYGFSVAEGMEPVPGRMPTASAYVARWTTIERLPFSVMYTGAEIHIVNEGAFYQKIALNYQFVGKAITNPGD